MARKFFVAVLIILALAYGIFRLSGCSNPQPPEDTETPDWPEWTPLVQPQAVEPEQEPLPKPEFDNLDTELRQLLASFGRPPLPSRYPRDVEIGARPADGLEIVTQILHSSLADDFIGRFDQGFIVPGAIVDCMPYVRADLNSSVRAMSGLRRNPYKVGLSTYVRDESIDVSTDRFNYTVEGALQSQQRQQITNTIYPRLNAEADQLRSPALFRRTARFARSYQEAQAKLGFSLSSPFVNIGLDTARESRSDRRVFLGVVQQEFFRLNAAPLAGGSASGPEVWLPSTEDNFRIIRGLAPDGRTLPGIPAIISEVRYGRVIIVAFEVDWSEERDELDLHVDGKYQSTSASVDVWREEIAKSRSATVDVFVYGGGPLPELPDLIDVEPEEGDAPGGATHRLRLDKESAVQVVDAILDAGRSWSSTQPGRPISVTFELLDDAGTVLKPLNTSLVELARAGRPGGGWKMVLTADVRNDYDKDSIFTGTDSGDWRFWWRHNGGELAHFDESVTATTRFVLTRPISSPAVWDSRVGGFEIEIIEDDGGFRGGSDGSNFSFPEEVKLDKPAAYHDFEAFLPEVEESLLALSEKFRETMKLESSQSSVEFQREASAAYKEHLADLESELATVTDRTLQLRQLGEKAIARMRSLRDNGVQPISHGDAGNTYTIVGKPDLTPYVEYVELTMRRAEQTRRNINRYVDRNRVNAP